MAEWFKAAVLKTVEPKGSVGSNPTSSASLKVCLAVQVLVAFIALTVMLLFPAQANAAQPTYTIDQLTTELYVETDASVHVIERRVITFEKTGEGFSWQLYEPEDGDVVEIVSARAVTLDGEGALEGDWTALELAFDDESAFVSCDFPVELKTYLVETDFRVSNRLPVYRDVGELHWRYAQSSMPVDAHDVSLRIALPVPAETEVVPNSTVRAWGHGPRDGSFTIGYDGSVSYWADVVPGGHYAEAHVLFPAYWLDNLGADSAQRHTSMRRASALSEEDGWVDRSARASIWDNKVRVLFLAIAGAVLCVAFILAAALGESVRTRRWLLRLAVALGIVALAESAFFREPITTCALVVASAAMALLALLMPADDAEPQDEAPTLSEDGAQTSSRDDEVQTLTISTKG